ncbi:MAG: DNA polymerase III subunit beta [Synergistaceae bacterium]|jgi:DNA polymerase-3 subunit beta|nr:DNA polymerase III subunit beta [Synergistaceae bacterium]
MRINIDKAVFLKSWNLAERSAGTSGVINIFSTVRFMAGSDKVELQTTDIKTSIICSAKGVTVLEPGEAVIPIKGISELFKKAGTQEFELHVDENRRAMMYSGRSKYRFSTYPVEDFPKLPSSSGADDFCFIEASKLQTALDRGTICASVGDEFPQYLAASLFEIDNGSLKVISTDKRRLAICGSEILEEFKQEQILLPMKGLKELQRVLGVLPPEAVIKIMFDDSQTYFLSDDVEFAVRRVESKFPSYSAIIPKSFKTEAVINRSNLISALERVDVVVRDFNKAVVIKMNADSKQCTLSGRAPEFGEAMEEIDCESEGGPVTIGVNTRYFHDAVKVIDDPSIKLMFNGPNDHMMVKPGGSDSFMCMVAPIEMNEIDEENSDGETEDSNLVGSSSEPDVL